MRERESRQTKTNGSSREYSASETERVNGDRETGKERERSCWIIISCLRFTLLFSLPSLPRHFEGSRCFSSSCCCCCCCLISLCACVRLIERERERDAGLVDQRENAAETMDCLSCLPCYLSPDLPAAAFPLYRDGISSLLP